MTSASAKNVRRLAIECADGVALRAEMAVPVDQPIRAISVLCHPHPLHGGSMYSHVVGGLFEGFPTAGVATLRFNFRGTSGSEGRHDGGRAEQLDVAAALDAAIDRTRELMPESGVPGEAMAPLPLLLIGYSFGGDVALAVSHPSVSAWLAIAPPLRIVAPENMAAATDSRPKHIVTGSDDEFCPPDQATTITGNWPSTIVTALPDQNHFLATAGAELLVIAKADVAELLDDPMTGSAVGGL